MKKMKFVCSALLACGLTSAAWAGLEPIKGSTSERLDSLEAKTQNVFAKAGILFGGEFYARALGSKIDGNITKGEDAEGNLSNATVAKTSENLLYTGLDLSIEARPLDAIGGIAIIRMHQDWRNMFGAMANPLTLRWISVEGNAKNLLTYNIGDFRQKYTPLTVWTPEPQIMFEPTIFARQREIAMGEEFLGGNSRVMQGANFNFGARVADGLQELRIGAFASRLRQTGEERSEDLMSIAPSVASSYGVMMDRFATAVNTDMVFVPGTQVGGTFLHVGDAKRTSSRSDLQTDSVATSNSIFGGRLRIGTELFGVDAKTMNIGLGGEFVSSNYGFGKKVEVEDGEDYFGKGTISGTALKANLDGKFNFGQNGLNLNIGFLTNEQNFRNELAQSPALFHRTILNTALLRENRDPFNTFDALYTSVFTYMPGEGEYRSLEGEVVRTGTKQPMRKSAWTRSTLTWDEIVNHPGLIEQNLSGALPLGEATPNRSGLVADFGLDFFNRAILLAGNARFLNDHQRDTIFINWENEEVSQKRQEFMEFGGGASVNIAKLGDWWAYPFILSGSYRQTTVDNFGGFAGQTNNISFINAGMYWKFWKRLALMGGYQVIDSEAKFTDGKESITQSQWATGLEYTVAEGGVLNATIGQVKVEHSTSDKDLNAEAIAGNFKSLRLNLNLTVKF